MGVLIPQFIRRITDTSLELVGECFIEVARCVNLFSIRNLPGGDDEVGVVMEKMFCHTIIPL